MKALKHPSADAVTLNVHTSDTTVIDMFLLEPSIKTIVLYCIVLYCIVLYCIVLYCIVLYCIVLYCIVFYCIVLYCIVLYCFQNVMPIFFYLKILKLLKYVLKQL